MTIAKAGTLFTATHGEYSDYSVEGIFRALVDFSPDEELAAYLALEENEEQRDPYCFSHRKFIGSLVNKGLIVEEDTGHLHLGEYGCHSGFYFRPARD